MASQAWQNLYYLPEIEAYEQLLLAERSAGMQTERTAAATAATERARPGSARPGAEHENAAPARGGASEKSSR